MTVNSVQTWPIGYAIHEMDVSLPQYVLDAYRDVPTAFVSDALGRGIGTIGLHAVGGDAIMCGPAVTVQTRAGDNLMVHKAVEMLRPGDILVVDAGGGTEQAVVGGNIRLHMLQRGAAGLILNGAIRDLTEFADGRLPTLARGVNHRGPLKEGPGTINVPISCAGLAVAPGDLVIGDPDGAVAVPRQDIEELIARVRGIQASEAKSTALGVSGQVPKGRFDGILRAKGCPI